LIPRAYRQKHKPFATRLGRFSIFKEDRASRDSKFLVLLIPRFLSLTTGHLESRIPGNFKEPTKKSVYILECHIGVARISAPRPALCQTYGYGGGLYDRADMFIYLCILVKEMSMQSNHAPCYKHELAFAVGYRNVRSLIEERDIKHRKDDQSWPCHLIRIAGTFCQNSVSSA